MQNARSDQLVEEVIERLTELLSMDLSERSQVEASFIVAGIGAGKMSVKMQIETAPFSFSMLLIGETGKTVVLRELKDPNRKIRFQMNGDGNSSVN